MPASQNQRGVRSPRERGVLLEARGDASGEEVGFVLPPQQGVVQSEREVAAAKIDWHLLVFPQQFAALHLNVRNRE